MLAALVLLLAPPGQAAVDSPRLVVHTKTAKAPGEIVLRQVAGFDRALVRLAAGSTLTLGQAPGGALGTVAAERVSGGAVQKLSGPLVAAAPETAVCDGAAHTAVWTAALSDGAQVVATLVLAADAAPAQILVCLAGAELADAKLQLLPAVLTPPTQPGRAMWEALFSFPNGEQVASAATLALPAKLTQRAAFNRFKRTVTLTGLLQEAGAAPPVSRRVIVLVGAGARALKPLGSTSTRPTGAWSGVITNVKRTLFVQARVTVQDVDVTATACATPSFAAPCVSATEGGFTATTGVLRVTVAKRA
jgi:hypothetical protein